MPRSSKKPEAPILVRTRVVFWAILSILSSLIIHEFQKLEYPLTFYTTLLTDTKNHEKKVNKKQKFFSFPLVPP